MIRILRKKTPQPRPTDVFYELRVAESALREISRQLSLIPSSALSDEIATPVINMDAAVGAWSRGLMTQQNHTV